MASVKQAAPPPVAGAGPPAKKVSGVKYNLRSMADFPVSVRAKKVEMFVLEILDLDQAYPDEETAKPDGLRTNHTIIRLVFKHKQGSTVSLVLDLEYDGSGTCRCSDGKLLVKPASYDGAHRYAAKTQEVPIRKRRGINRDKTVKDFLQVLFQDDLIPCGFNTENVRAAGCKDFA